MAVEGGDARVDEDGEAKVLPMGVTAPESDTGKVDGKGNVLVTGGSTPEAGNGKEDGDVERSVFPTGGKASDGKPDEDGGVLPASDSGDGKPDEVLPAGNKAVSLNASRKGTEISLQHLRLCDGAATLIATRLSLILACGRCTSRDEIDLMPGQLYTVNCSRCHQSQLLKLNTDIAHSMSSVVGFMDLDGCQPVDLVLTTSQFVVGCLSCSNDATIDVSICNVKCKV